MGWNRPEQHFLKESDVRSSSNYLIDAHRLSKSWESDNTNDTKET